MDKRKREDIIAYILYTIAIILFIFPIIKFITTDDILYTFLWVLSLIIFYPVGITILILVKNHRDYVIINRMKEDEELKRQEKIRIYQEKKAEEERLALIERDKNVKGAAAKYRQEKEAEAKTEQERIRLQQAKKAEELKQERERKALIKWYMSLEDDIGNFETEDSKEEKIKNFENSSNNKRLHKGSSQILLLNDYVVIDIETTGLNPNKDEITEIAAIKISGGNIVEQFATLIKTENELSNAITNLTGITNEMLADAPNMDDILPDFSEFIGDSILVGHNINFDINFLYSYFENLLRKSLKNNFVDTMIFSKNLFDDFDNYKLPTLVKNFNIKGGGFHRALADCEYTYKCYEYMKKYIIEKNINIDNFYNKNFPVTSKYIAASKKIEISNESVIFEKIFVFTGELEKMSRSTVRQVLENLGGIFKDSVTMKTNYLILADNSSPYVIDGKSNKQKKAEEYALRGLDIKIISESDFYEMLPEAVNRMEAS